MKKISLNQQRKLCNAYKDARIAQANNLISLYHTGSYSAPDKSTVIDNAKKDIMNFTSVFEDKVIEEMRIQLSL